MPGEGSKRAKHWISAYLCTEPHTGRIPWISMDSVEFCDSVILFPSAEEFTESIPTVGAEPKTQSNPLSSP